MLAALLVWPSLPDAAKERLSPKSAPVLLPIGGVSNEPQVQPIRIAIGFALIAACGAGFVSAMLLVGGWSDFSQLALGAQALRHGLNPYLAASAPRTGLPLVYPMPAVLLALPWTLLPMAAAHASFSAFGVGALAYAHARSGPIERPAIVAFFSAAMLHTILLSQWPALLLGAVMLSNQWLGGALLTCKPTTAIWLWAMRPSWRAIGGALVATTISLVVRPSWPLEWWTATSMARAYLVIPALLPFGFLIAIAAALRWRRPEARLLLAMCCVPHAPFPYEALPLIAMTPKTWTEAWILCACSWVSYVSFTVLIVGKRTLVPTVHLAGLWSLALIYAPCAIMLLRRKNVRQ